MHIFFQILLIVSFAVFKPDSNWDVKLVKDSPGISAAFKKKLSFKVQSSA